MRAEGTTQVLLRRKGLGRPAGGYWERFERSGGRQSRRPEHKEIAAGVFARRSGPPDPIYLWGKDEDAEEEPGKSTQRAR